METTARERILMSSIEYRNFDKELKVD